MTPPTSINGTEDRLTVLDYALGYRAAKIAVTPILPNGEKRPFLKGWQNLAAPTPDELQKWFGDGRNGIGLRCGKASGNLELLDFDVEADTIFPTWCALVEQQAPGLVARLCQVRTPSGRFHCWYTCRAGVIPGNLKLATDYRYDDTGKIQRDAHGNALLRTLIETRGEGGQGLAPGSPGACHDAGGQYQHHAGRTFSELADLSPDERELLHETARSFQRAGVNQPRQSRPQAVSAKGDGVRPGDDYIRCGPPIEELLQGWEVVQETADGVLRSAPARQKQGLVRHHRALPG